MKEFLDEAGQRWAAGAREEDTPRHHGRWYLVFHPADDANFWIAMPEVRWQTSATAARTLQTMSDFELRRRLHIVRERGRVDDGASPVSGAGGHGREQTNANAG
ncbi:MAG TPA: hypothetical protein VK936_01355 [Longimicrobiales bacterium]|nr:hypothetical protein [Longimicrobiales bacterium]